MWNRRKCSGTIPEKGFRGQDNRIMHKYTLQPWLTPLFCIKIRYSLKKVLFTHYPEGYSRLMSIIEAKGLCKTYQSAVKEPGLAGAVKHVFKPVYREIDAVRDVNL